jgi:deazaflavin-dependent oxidoreductase (nitroreductase family)
MEEKLRQAFKSLNRFMLLMWRVGLGRWLSAWPRVGGQFMVITHIGRKTGLRRRTPVNYAIVDGEVYCVAGFGSISDWYRNLRVQPDVEVWLPDGWWAGVAEEVRDSEKRLPLLREVLIGSGFAARLAGVDPYALSDLDLRLATTRYHLIHIQRTSARTGRDGPGDLAWVWPLAATILLPLVALTRRSK